MSLPLNRDVLCISDRLAEMNDSRIRAILDADKDKASIFYTKNLGSAVQIHFPRDIQNASYSIIAEGVDNETVRIETWVVTKSTNFGFYIEDVLVTEEGFVDAVLALRPKLTIDAVQAAYDAQYD